MLSATYTKSMPVILAQRKTMSMSLIHESNIFANLVKKSQKQLIFGGNLSRSTRC